MLISFELLEHLFGILKFLGKRCTKVSLASKASMELLYSCEPTDFIGTSVVIKLFFFFFSIPDHTREDTAT